MNYSCSLRRDELESILVQAATAAFSACREFEDLLLQRDRERDLIHPNGEVDLFENAILRLSQTLSDRTAQNIKTDPARVWVSLAVQDVVEYAYAWYCHVRMRGIVDPTVFLTWYPSSPQPMDPCPMKNGRTIGRARIEDLERELWAQEISLT